MSTVHYRVDDTVAVLTIDNPPVNALAQSIRAGLLENLRRAAADAEVKAIVLIGGGRTFIAGADIREFGKPLQPPHLPELLGEIEASRKPIIAALHGTALGGGLEVALACHYRVAVPSVKVGLPEVNLGLLPGAGGTQRLPRLIGAQQALEMILSGKPVDGRTALAFGIVDELTGDEFLPGALPFARRVAAEARPLPLASRKQDRVANTDPAIFAAARSKNAKKWQGLLAQWKIIDCVEQACTADFAQGTKFERESFYALKDSPQSAALRYAFFAEREASKIPGLPEDIAPKPIKSAAIVGAGTMGGGIAMCFANAGIPVKQLEVNAEALARGRAIVEKNYATSVARGSMRQENADRALALIKGVTDYAALADCDIVIEAAFEEMGIKREIFGRLDKVMKPGAVLASNTSTLDIDQIAAATQRPQDVIGTHFFSPANVMRLQENVRGKATSPQTIATVMALARTIGKVPVLAGNCHGFIGNRILYAYGRECDFLLEEGATPWQIDRALQGFGFPMGVYLMRDLAGLDVSWRVRKGLAATRDPRQRYSPIADRICELGRFGQKTGAGYYQYEGRNATPDPAIEALILRTSAELGIARQAVADADIVERVLSMMVNEGARILGEGIALRASDIDVIYLYGYGFPRHQGGPMWWAQQQGLGKVLAMVERQHQAQGERWAPAPLLQKLGARNDGGRWPDAAGS